MDISRRSFLKRTGLLSAGIVGLCTGLVSYPVNALAVPKKVEPATKYSLSLPPEKVRILVAYDITWDAQFIRYDISDGVTQLHITAQISSEITKQQFRVTHKYLLKQLKAGAKTHKLNLNKLIPLEYPINYTHPAWLQKLLV